MAPGCSRLNVIALVSGGKDSFFSALHCLENGHRIVALANLYPPPTANSAPVVENSSRVSRPASVGEDEASGAKAPAAAAAGGAVHHAQTLEAAAAADQEETDLNSFMYQTVGHQVIPLYAEATGLPLYRRPINGGAVQSGRDYHAIVEGEGGGLDETESMVPLLQAVLSRHPEANALCAGAILSTYQRTRVESVALRLGLTPLAFLWKYPVLPPPPPATDDAQLLFDMAAAGLEARIIKVASGGLDEAFLWENVASAKGIARLKRAMGRFGSAGMDTGAVLGEGGEFETLVVDGPGVLFKKRILVAEHDRIVVREGGGTAWVRVGRAELGEKDVGGAEQPVIRRAELWDERFAAVLDVLKSGGGSEESRDAERHTPMRISGPFRTLQTSPNLHTWAFIGSQDGKALTIQEETSLLIDSIRTRLAQHGLTPTSILSTVVLLRSMADFPTINAVYATLFPSPNPPSRVTVSCGDLLPGNIAVYLTLHEGGGTDRQGLHVQSRSYWAPANIGPYSQAITFPAASAAAGGGTARLVHVAGQIPLIPASMALPAPGIETHLALSLQHLWRIGLETGVRWWTSAALFLPRSTATRETALLAWTAWKTAHEWSSSINENDDDESGPDLWDRKFNPQYMTYGDSGAGASDAKNRPHLPDYTLLLDEDEASEQKPASPPPVPYLFAVEVDELPRSAAAEWHAHAGLAAAAHGASSVRVYGEGHGTARVVEHCALLDRDGDGDSNTVLLCLHSVVAVEAGAAAARGGLDGQLREADRVLGASVAKLTTTGARDQRPSPYLVYVDTDIFDSEQIGRAISVEGLAVVPCASIYGGPSGTRLGVVVLYRNDFLSTTQDV